MGESTFVGPTCARCQMEISGVQIWEGSVAYHPACAPSCIAVDPSGVAPEDAIRAAATLIWEAEKAEVVARLSKALGMTGSVTLEGLLSETEKRLQKFRDDLEISGAGNCSYEEGFRRLFEDGTVTVLQVAEALSLRGDEARDMLQGEE